MLVRISKTGWKLLDDKKLARHVLEALIRKKKDLEEGDTIQVEGSPVKVHLVTSICDASDTPHKKNSSNK